MSRIRRVHVKLHGDIKSHLTDNGQLCFARALSVPCIALNGKVVHQQLFFVEMLYVAFEDLFRSSVEKSTMLGGGIEKALAVEKMAEP